MPTVLELPLCTSELPASHPACPLPPSSPHTDDQFEDAAGPTLSGMPSGSGGLVFSLGSGGMDDDRPAPAKRGGRPREKKSYDALIDPSLPPEEIRRLRRMLSNRESARRSRRRRQTQLSTLEVELEQLKNGALLL